MSDPLASLAPWILDWSIKASVLFAIAVSANAILRQGWTELTLALHRAVMAILLAGPFAMLGTSRLMPVQTPGAEAAGFAGLPFDRHVDIMSFAMPTNLWVSPALLGAAVVVWLCGVSLSFCAYARSVRSLRAAYFASTRIPGRLIPVVAAMQRRCDTHATIAATDMFETPCAFGIVQPTVLIPKPLLEAPAWHIEAVLTHELLHIKNRDPLWLLIGELVFAFHWFNPLAWVCVSRHRQLIEQQCDAHAIRAGVPLLEYARAIAATSRQILGRRDASAAMAAEGVVVRLRNLLEERETRLLSLTWRYVIGVVSVVLVASLSSTRLAAKDRAPILEPQLEASAHLQSILRDTAVRIGTVPAGHARLYAIVPPSVSLRALDAGFICEGMNCVTTVTARPLIKLFAQSTDGSDLRWQGCAPSLDNRSCTVRMADGEHVVQVAKTDR